VSTDDKKEGLTIWQRTTSIGNAVKATGIINRSPTEIFQVLGDPPYKE